MSDDLIAHFGAHFTALYNKIAHLEGIIERTHRPGTITDVDYSDATKPRIRVQVGVDDQGQPVKGPWAPHSQHAGDFTNHTPLTVGQQVLQIAPDGNFENALVIPYGFSKPIKSPSTSPTDHVYQMGDLTRTLNKSGHTRTVKKMVRSHTADGFSWSYDGGKTKLEFTSTSIKHTVGGVTHTITKDGIATARGTLTHDDLNIGSTHKHTGVQPGGGITGVPEA